MAPVSVDIRVGGSPFEGLFQGWYREGVQAPAEPDPLVLLTDVEKRRVALAGMVLGLLDDDSKAENRRGDSPSEIV